MYLYNKCPMQKTLLFRFASWMLVFLMNSISPALADNPYARTISFNDGSRISTFAWFDENNVLLYAINPNGSILWKHNIHDGTRSKVITATQLEKLFPSGTNISNLKLSVSPGHNYLLFYEPFSDPAVRPFFRVISLKDGEPKLVNFEHMPDNFWVKEFAWDPTDQYLYVAAVPYLFPNEPTSIARLSLNTNSFVALVVKDNADLIDEIVYSFELDALIIDCWSFRGEYPADHYILKYDFYENSASILGLFPYVHSMFITDSGKDIYFSLVSRDTNKDGVLDFLDESDISTFNLEKKENQVLVKHSGYELQPSLTPDRKWLGYLRIPERIGEPPEYSDSKDLWIMQLDTRREILVQDGCAQYLFSLDSKKVLALSEDRLRLEVYSIPSRT